MASAAVPRALGPHELPQPTGTRPRRAGAKQKKKAKAHDRKERRDTRRSIEIASANDTAAGKRQSDRSADEERTESVLLARMSTEDQLLQKQAIVHDFRQLESPAERLQNDRTTRMRRARQGQAVAGAQLCLRAPPQASILMTTCVCVQAP